MTDKQQAVIDAWIALYPCRCVVYCGDGAWWPAEVTNDGPQPLPGVPIYRIDQLVSWCEARLAEAAYA